MVTQTFWDFLGKAGIIFGILTFIFSILIWLNVKVQSRKIQQMAANTARMDEYKELKDYHESIQTTNPMAFCLSLISQSTSIKNDVNSFLRGKGMRMKIVELNTDGLNPDTIQLFIESLRLKRQTDLADATEVHLFLQGPVQAGILVGAIFDNWKPVKLYQFNSKLGTYDYWGPLVK